MKNYLNLLEKVLLEGKDKPDRTGVGTVSLFAEQLRFDLRDGYPLVTTKKTHFKSIKEELLWFLRGETNIESLQRVGVRIWNDWADNRGELGPVYGAQWRGWTGYNGYCDHDQIATVINTLRTDPHSRRMIVSAWNVTELADMALAPCHCLFQFYSDGRHLDCQLYQRSADIFLGVPFNIASYALLTAMIAQVTGLKARHFIHTFGDVHLYQNHLAQAREQIGRSPGYLPQLHLNPAVTNIDDFRSEDIKVSDYHPQSPLPAPVAV